MVLPLPPVHRTSMKEGQQTKTSLSLLLLITTFTIGWYYASSKNAIATQQLVQAYQSYGYANKPTNLATMAVLTSLQILVGLCISFLLNLLSKGYTYTHHHTSAKTTITNCTNKHLSKQLLVVGSLHFLGCLCTNMSFSYGSAVLVQAIKLLEPIETLFFVALVNVFYLHRPHGITATRAMAVLLVVLGASLLLLQKGISASINPFSVAFAFISGIIMASRNVVQKSRTKNAVGGQLVSNKENTRADKQDDWLSAASNGLNGFVQINAIAAIPACISLVLAEVSHWHSAGMDMDMDTDTHICSWIWNSADACGIHAVLFHGLYNIASISVLSLISAQTHSLLNVGKRIMNVAMASIAFGVQLENSGIFGLLIAAIGGLVYSRKFTPSSSLKSRRHQYTYRNQRFFFIVVTLMFLGSCTMYYKFVGDEAAAKRNAFEEFFFAEPLQSEAIVALVSVPEKRKIVLLGPHDRYNFGDLLFEKVVSKLLQTKAGYRDHEIVRAGIVSVDMSAYGGPANVLSMRKVQEMSRKSSNGPFDIVYTGGEALGCSYGCAEGMMPSNDLERMAKAEKIYDCAYLVPKKLLLPLGNSTRKNQAVVNSVGGYYGDKHPACQKAVDTADYVSFRDEDPGGVPDSAVMVRELYGDHVSSVATTVLKELFPDGAKRKYIAVQHKIEMGMMGMKKNKSSLAQALDEVSKQSNCTIVFFVAGTAPGHDSLEVYQKVASEMTAPSIIYEAKHVWKAVALLSEAEAVLSSSLHVRIMAFIFLKPRVTWCTEKKHEAFIRKWDASDASRCVGTYQATWSVLSKYMGEAPAISLSKTEEAYGKAVELYQHSFDTWSGLINQ